jgi:hypothetical protein
MIKLLASIAVCFILCIPLSFSQINPNISNAPGSASLVSAQRESQAKVDLFTGLPAINFPLFNYQGIRS